MDENTMGKRKFTRSPWKLGYRTSPTLHKRQASEEEFPPLQKSPNRSPERKSPVRLINTVWNSPDGERQANSQSDQNIGRIDPDLPDESKSTDMKIQNDKMKNCTLLDYNGNHSNRLQVPHSDLTDDKFGEHTQMSTKTEPSSSHNTLIKNISSLDMELDTQYGGKATNGPLNSMSESQNIDSCVESSTTLPSTTGPLNSMSESQNIGSCLESSTTLPSTTVTTDTTFVQYDKKQIERETYVNPSKYNTERADHNENTVNTVRPLYSHPVQVLHDDKTNDSENDSEKEQTKRHNTAEISLSQATNHSDQKDYDNKAVKSTIQSSGHLDMNPLNEIRDLVGATQCQISLNRPRLKYHLCEPISIFAQPIYNQSSYTLPINLSIDASVCTQELVAPERAAFQKGSSLRKHDLSTFSVAHCSVFTNLPDSHDHLHRSIQLNRQNLSYYRTASVSIRNSRYVRPTQSVTNLSIQSKISDISVLPRTNYVYTSNDPVCPGDIIDQNQDVEEPEELDWHKSFLRPCLIAAAKLVLENMLTEVERDCLKIGLIQPLPRIVKEVRKQNSTEISTLKIILRRIAKQMAME